MKRGRSTTGWPLLVHLIPNTMPHPTTTPSREAIERLVAEAERWAALVAKKARLPKPVCRKALQALAFTLTHGGLMLAVPSKLVGVLPFQRALWALQLLRPSFGLRFAVAREGRRLAVRLASDVAQFRAGTPIGFIQAKHVPWLLPLLQHGAEVRLTAVTGGDARRPTLGVNVHLVVGSALRSVGETPSEEEPDAEGAGASSKAA